MIFNETDKLKQELKVTNAKMTRQQAIECFKKHMPTKTNPESVIDFYIEAGMLEIVEEDLILETVAAKTHLPMRAICDVIKEYEKLGYQLLKIVEK